MVAGRALPAIAAALLLRGAVARKDYPVMRTEGARPSVKIRTKPDDPFRVFRLRHKVAAMETVDTDADMPPPPPGLPSMNEVDGQVVGGGSNASAPGAKATGTSTERAIVASYAPTLSPHSIPCPPSYDPRRTDYVAGDVVEVYNTMFVCRPSPYEEYCNIATWAQIQLFAKVDGEEDAEGLEEREELWLNAWREMGACAAVDDSLDAPSEAPSTIPPSAMPSSSASPSRSPSLKPTHMPTDAPTWPPTYIPTPYPTYYPTGVPTLSPTTSEPTASPLALAPDAYVDNSVPFTQNITTNVACSSSQILLRIEVQTDSYPTDISWQFIDRTDNIILLASPLEGYRGEKVGSKMMVPQLDIRDICLNSTSTATRYEFVIEDEFGDGLCCRSGVEPGYYKLMQYEESFDDKWMVLVSGSNFKSKEVRHHFELRLENDINGNNSGGALTVPGLEQARVVEEQLVAGEEATDAPSTSQLRLLCPSPQRKVTIEVQTDNFGFDTSWEFRAKAGPVLAKNERTYPNKVHIDTRDVCLDDASLYELTVNDVHGDGMCCRYNEGHYKIYDQNGEVILNGGSFMANSVTHLINTTAPYMTERDVKWLDSHNKRRKYWHAYYNTTYVPLMYSESLKAEAQVWADALLDSCGEGMHHDPQREFGENAAGNTGSGSWGTKREPEKIVARFVDYEVDWPWPSNSHLTQALWRATKYVGCADSHKVMGGKNDRQCHTQVCRYAKTGNCNMNAHENEDGTVDWKTPMLEDVSHCGEICPTGGCRA